MILNIYILFSNQIKKILYKNFTNIFITRRVHKHDLRKIKFENGIKCLSISNLISILSREKSIPLSTSPLDFFRDSITKFVGMDLPCFFIDRFPGYGHSTPNTISGKLFTMFYAIVGIPLGLVMFQSIGERLNKFSSVVIRNVKKLLNCKDVQVKL